MNPINRTETELTRFLIPTESKILSKAIIKNIVLRSNAVKPASLEIVRGENGSAQIPNEYRYERDGVQFEFRYQKELKTPKDLLPYAIQ